MKPRVRIWERLLAALVVGAGWALGTMWIGRRADHAWWTWLLPLGVYPLIRLGNALLDWQDRRTYERLRRRRAAEFLRLAQNPFLNARNRQHVDPPQPSPRR